MSWRHQTPKHETRNTFYWIHSSRGGRGCDGQLSNFSEHLYGRDEGQIAILGENWHFRWGWFFFKLELKISFTKNSECKSQAKQMILIVISTISDFWSPTLTNLWLLVFVLLFSMVYIPPNPQLLFLWGVKFLFVSCS